MKKSWRGRALLGENCSVNLYKMVLLSIFPGVEIFENGYQQEQTILVETNSFNFVKILLALIIIFPMNALLNQIFVLLNFGEIEKSSKKAL